MGFKEDDPCGIQKSPSKCSLVSLIKSVLDIGYSLQVPRPTIFLQLKDLYFSKRQTIPTRFGAFYYAVTDVSLGMNIAIKK
jgi:hypothetical protein